jgi:hypothetical protein
VGYGYWGGGDAAEEGGDGDGAVVGSFGALCCYVGCDWLPCLVLWLLLVERLVLVGRAFGTRWMKAGRCGTYPVVGAHVHVDAPDVDAGRVEVEVDAPQGGAEGVG